MTGWESQLRKGVVELAVLAAIGHGETYGYRIVSRSAAARLASSSRRARCIPCWRGWRRTGFWRFATEESPRGPNRRYYRLTAAGRERLRRMTECWRTVSESLKGLLEGANA